jgi:two-component system, chemotaxis family, sensor kinase Cph1
VQGNATRAEADLDLSVCDREPIHIPGSIQPHGALLVARGRDLSIEAASVNAEAFIGLSQAPVGCRLREVLPDGGAALWKELEAWAAGVEPAYLRSRELGGRCFDVAAHRSGNRLLIEFETAPDDETASLEALYPRLRLFLDELNGLDSIASVNDAAARMVRELTGFDRVLIYRFDEDWNGTVVAEDNSGRLPVYLDLRFPASDIPAQARELYRLNRLRLIPDADYTPVPILPKGDAPLDLSLSVLRSVSPVHCQYMRNMGTPASMSISIVVDGSLWGLISCHHASPRRVPAHVRAACELLGQMQATQIAGLMRSEESRQRLHLKSIQSGLLASMAEEGAVLAGLAKRPIDLLDFANAQGAVVTTGDGIEAVGVTPAREDIEALLGWLESRGSPDVFVTNEVGRVMRGMKGLAKTASGLMAISISRLYPSYVIWFRPEVVETVTWGGDPRKRAEVEPGRPLTPRTSFEQWKEQVRGRAMPWRPAEVEAARELRNAILGIVLRQAEERAQLTDRLEASNKELEAFSYSVSHDLRAPFRHIVGFAELLQDRERSLEPKSRHYLETIIDAAKSAGRLVDDLLSFSHIGRASLARTRVDMNKVVEEVRRSLEHDTQGRRIDWTIGDLPVALGDPPMLRQVMANLIGNAVKYTRNRERAEIVLSATDDGDGVTYSVRDNGVGFDMAYAHKLFGVFQRLHRVEEFEGTGIGLAIAKRIVDRHGGRIWAEGKVGEGATISFTLPKSRNDDD